MPWLRDRLVANWRTSLVGMFLLAYGAMVAAFGAETVGAWREEVAAGLALIGGVFGLSRDPRE